MWVTKLMISPVKKRIFCPKTTKFGPKLAFLVDMGLPCRFFRCPVGWSVGGCGARAVSRKTPIYFIQYNVCVCVDWEVGLYMVRSPLDPDGSILAAGGIIPYPALPCLSKGALSTSHTTKLQ